MDWAGLKTVTEGQGLYFWLSAGAIAAGTTLLIVALMIQTRKILAKGSLFSARKPGLGKVFSRPRAASAVPKPQISVTDTGYTNSAAGVDNKNESLNANEPSSAKLSALLERLKIAGDTLEGTRINLERHKNNKGLSRLKNSVAEVEYVFKAGVS